MRLREVRLGPFDLELEHRPDGTIRARSPHSLGNYPSRLTERLERWAEHAPARTFLAKRGPDGAWRRLTYAETLEGVRRIGQALLERGLSPERPLAILSGNDLEHALLALAAQHVGIPYAPISPAYSLVSNDFRKLHQIMELLRPGLVFAASGTAYEAAIKAAVSPTTEIVVAVDPPAGRAATSFADLLATAPTSGVEAAAAGVGPDTIAKFLFTSGSTGMPKAVINTQRMLCSNQAMIATMLAFLQDEPPVMVDWLPWHHTAGGNHNIGLVLWNGGTLYIDDGRPTAAEIGETVRNLREIATTFYVNVPKGFEVLLPYLEDDAALRARFFSQLKLMFYAGAHLAQHVWEALQRHAAGGDRRAHPDADRAGRDRDRAVRIHARQGGEPGGRGRPAGARDRAQARVVGSRALRRPPQGPQHHARATGASRRRPQRRSTRKASTGSATRCASSILTRPKRVSCSTAGSRRTSSCRPAPGCTSASCAAPSLRSSRRCFAMW